MKPPLFKVKWEVENHAIHKSYKYNVNEGRKHRDLFHGILGETNVTAIVRK
jgi:hypothetical protein